MTSLFDRLQFNFDQTKFGTNLDLSEESLNTLESMATDIELSDWQLNDMANNNVVNTNYFINPIANVCNSISANVSNLISSIYTIPSPDVNVLALLNSSLNCIIQLDRFKSHTDNISGISETTGSQEIPTYSTAIDTGQVLLTILNKTDGFANSLPAMGSFTSLFILDELMSNNITIGESCEYFIAGANGFISLTPTTSDSTTITSDSSTITSDAGGLSVVEINTLKNEIDNFNTFLYDRWTHDWTFYESSNKLIDDYTKVTNLSNIGTTQKYLIDNYIGTEKIKTDIANNNVVIPVTEPPVVVPPPSYYDYFNQF